MRTRLLIALALLLTAMSSGAQNLNIGGHRAVLDTLNHIWLCSIPQDIFGEDFTATVNYDDGMKDLAIEGTAIKNGDDFTFRIVDGGKEYTVTAYMGDSLITGRITFTWLPVVELYGSFDDNYSIGTVTVSEPDSAYAEPMLAKIKWRGIATNTKDKHKRNYRIKFIKEDSTKQNRRFFGLRKDNSWILDAGQMDFLRVRNRVSTDLWLDMSRRPWYAGDSLPDLHNGSRGQMVEVLLNGAYVGIYNMCEPIDRKQLQLVRYDTIRNRIRGELWTAYERTSTTTMSAPKKRPAGTRYWNGFEVKYPDFDEIRRTFWTPMTNAVYFASRADTSALKLRIDSMGYYFDLPVMQDYYIFIIALQALDNESKNIYYALYDADGDRRLTMTPWDLDICLGQNYAPSVNLPEMVKPERDVTDWMQHVPMADMLEVKSYRDQILARYRELRETYLDTENLVERYRSAIDELEFCGAAAREEKRWSGDSDLAGKTLDLAAEMDYVEDWIRRRMAYLDEFIFIEKFPKGDVNGDGEVGISDVNALIDIILGATVDEQTEQRADVDGDGEIGLSDINAVIDIILGV